MKAQFIYENLDFERGRDPKESIGLGLYEVIKNGMRQLLGLPEVKHMVIGVYGENPDPVLEIFWQGSIKEFKKYIEKYLGNYLDTDIKYISKDWNSFTIYPQYVNKFDRAYEEVEEEMF
jgi:hypothetical protein